MLFHFNLEPTLITVVTVKLTTVAWDDFKQNLKDFQKDLHRIKDFSSEIPNLFFSKWTLSARQCSQYGLNRADSALLPRGLVDSMPLQLGFWENKFGIWRKIFNPVYLGLVAQILHPAHLSPFHLMLHRHLFYNQGMVSFILILEAPWFQKCNFKTFKY